MQNYVYTKWEMIVVRGGAVRATCDMTGAVIGQNGELHHLIHRSWTRGNEKARLLSEVPELTSYLSHTAHASFHDRNPNESERDKLFYRLYSLFGYNRVKDAFQRVQDAMKSPLPISLPEEQRDEQENDGGI